METKRQRQVAELVKRNFSIVLQEIGSYIYGTQPLVTVTEVKMSSDMGLAKIYLSVWNTENKQAVLLELEEEYPRLRSALGARLRRHVRRIPNIALYEDETIDEMYRVESLFERLHEEDQMGKSEDKTSESADQ